MKGWRKFLLFALPGSTLVLVWWLSRMVRSYVGVAVNSPDMPFGIRHDNPMNLTDPDPLNPIAWDGRSGTVLDSAGNSTPIFSTPEKGIRAGVKNVQSLGITTVDGIAQTWSGKNDPSYIGAVVGTSGLLPGVALDLSDAPTLVAIAKGIVRGENGPGIWYPDSVYQAGVSDALS